MQVNHFCKHFTWLSVTPLPQVLSFLASPLFGYVLGLTFLSILTGDAKEKGHKMLQFLCLNYPDIIKLYMHSLQIRSSNG